MKTICMIVDGYFPQDIRVRKEVEALKNDFKVVVLCRGKADQEHYEVDGNLHIHRDFDYKNLSDQGWNDIYVSLFKIHRRFLKGLQAVCKKHWPDVIHVHDLPLFSTAYIVARNSECKIVLDLHENYPAGLGVWYQWKRSLAVRIKNALFFNPKRWSKYEKIAVKNSDRIITVVREMKERLVRETKMDERSFWVVENQESVNFAKQMPSDHKNSYEGAPFPIAYAGGVGPHRGIHTAIAAMPKILEQEPDASLWIIGPASADAQTYLSELTAELGLQDKVHFLGRQPFEKFNQFMKDAAINIIPHANNDHTNYTVPHKLFQIMMSGQPLLVSSCPPLRRIVGEQDLGYVFESDNAEDFAEKAVYIKSNYDEALEKAKKAQEVTLEGDLNWEHEGGRLLQHYKEFLNE